MSKSRIAGRLIWLAEPAAPPDGRSSIFTDLPLAAYSTRPSVTSLTKAVFNQMPGSAGEPSATFVTPKLRSPAGSSTAKASARSSAVVVSNCSTVRAVGGGGGGASRSGRATGEIVCSCGAATSTGGTSQADKAIKGKRKSRFISGTLCAPAPRLKRFVRPCAGPRAALGLSHDNATH